MAYSAGTKLGPYEIVAPIGAGGMGEVYRAHDSRLQHDVAIKVSHYGMPCRSPMRSKRRTPRASRIAI
jgi:hypothetical protein